MNYSFTVKRWNVQFNGTKQNGIADIVTPKITFPKVSVAGAGIIGAPNLPVIGMPDIGPTTITWHAPSQDVYQAFSGQAMSITCKSAILTYANAGSTGSAPSYSTQPEIIQMTCFSDELDPGRRESSNKATVTQSWSVTYLLITMNGKTYHEIDPFSGTCILNGVDVNANDGI
jgi:P2 family phage contractile tail tube protein